MHLLLVGLLATGLHLVLTFAALLFASAPAFRRMEAGLPRTAFDRLMQRMMRVIVFPIHPIINRYPALLARTGWPREHLLLLANSAVWGIAAGVSTALM